MNISKNVLVSTFQATVLGLRMILKIDFLMTIKSINSLDAGYTGKQLTLIMQEMLKMTL